MRWLGRSSSRPSERVRWIGGFSSVTAIRIGTCACTVGRIVRIDENPHAKPDVTRPDLVARELVGAAVEHLLGVVVLVDDLQRQEPLARVRQGERHRPGSEVEHALGIERVAVGADDGVVDRRQLAGVAELAQRAVLDHEAEVDVGLGAVEVVGGHRRGLARRRLQIGTHPLQRRLFPRAVERLRLGPVQAHRHEKRAPRSRQREAVDVRLLRDGPGFLRREGVLRRPSLVVG
jgi:hypothetical protein